LKKKCTRRKHRVSDHYQFGYSLELKRYLGEI
jgi:hypothetical protein